MKMEWQGTEKQERKDAMGSVALGQGKVSEQESEGEEEEDEG